MKKTKVVLILFVALYLGANLIVPRVITLVHRLRLHVIVKSSGQPVSGAKVSTGRSSPVETSLTNELGEADVEMVLKKQPLWLWPLVGDFNLENTFLSVESIGYIPKKFRLSDVVPATPLKVRLIDVSVELDKKP